MQEIARLELQNNGAQDSEVVIPVERLEARARDFREGGVRRSLRQLLQHEREFRPAEQHGQPLACGGLPSSRGDARRGDRDDQIKQCSFEVDSCIPRALQRPVAASVGAR